MEDKTMIPINIWIADRQYRIKVPEQQEGMVRQTLKLINDKIIEFKNSFPGKDMQDLVSMVLIWFATENNQGMPMADEKNILEGLAKITAALHTVNSQAIP